MIQCGKNIPGPLRNQPVCQCLPQGFRFSDAAQNLIPHHIFAVRARDKPGDMDFIAMLFCIA